MKLILTLLAALILLNVEILRAAEIVAETRKAAEQGNAAAQVDLGAQYVIGLGVSKDNAQAVKWFRKAAEQGYAPAQYHLGLAYRHGSGVPNDDAQAVAWFRKAADQGDAYAEVALGGMYRDGRGVPNDDLKAVEWYHKGVEQGNHLAQSGLGWMYANGRGVPKNLVLAHAWTSLAAEKLESNALTNLPLFKRLMTPQQIAEAQRVAEALKAVAKNGGSSGIADIENRTLRDSNDVTAGSTIGRIIGYVALGLIILAVFFRSRSNVNKRSENERKESPSGYFRKTHSAFDRCPHCGCIAYRRLDSHHGKHTFSDSNFFLSLSIWIGLLPALPVFLFLFWQPGSEAVAQMGKLFFTALIEIAQAGAWWFRHAGVLLIVAALCAWMLWALFAGCVACCVGTIGDHHFRSRSIPSRMIVALVKAANLRFTPWIGLCSIVTSSVVWVLLGISTLYFCTASPRGWIFIGIFTLPWAVWMTFDANRKTRLRGVTFHRLRNSLFTTLRRLPLLIVVLLPGLALKAAVDWGSNRLLDSIEMRASGLTTASVPVFSAGKYPWHSPLRWVGVPRYYLSHSDISLKEVRKGILFQISLARAVLGGIELLAAIVLFLLFFRALLAMFFRECVVNGVSINSYIPHQRHSFDTSEAAEAFHHIVEANAVPSKVSTHSSLEIDELWGKSVFLKRDLSPSGGVPSTEIPTPMNAFLARLLHRCLVVDRYELSTQTLCLSATNGRCFVRWPLREGEAVCISFRQLVGWTDRVKLGTSVCLQLGMLAQGELLVHPTVGPGSLIFELHGDPGPLELTSETIFQSSRLVAQRLDLGSGDAHPEFGLLATEGTLNALLGNAAIKANPGSNVLLDPQADTGRFRHPVTSLLRYAYSLFG